MKVLERMAIFALAIREFCKEREDEPANLKRSPIVGNFGGRPNPFKRASKRLSIYLL